VTAVTRPGMGLRRRLKREFASVADLRAEYVADELARLLDFRHREGTVNLFSITAGYHNASGFEHGEMLREIGGGYAQLLLQFRPTA